MGPEIGMLAAEELVMDAATCTLVAEELLVGAVIDILEAVVVLCLLEAAETISMLEAATIIGMLGSAAIGMLVVEDWTWDRVWTGSKAENNATTNEGLDGVDVVVLDEAVSLVFNVV